MSTPASPSGITSDAPTVVAVILAEEGVFLEACLEAVARQAYSPVRVWVVGGDEASRASATKYEAVWRADLRAVVETLAPDLTYVWLVKGRSRPLPDALGALVEASGRTEAAIAGSKVLDADDRTRLVSVGYATDVFGAPYSGLQNDEVDQQQYDVIRDVAAVSGASMLVRRDLLLGLRGLDRRMAPTAASIDLCQRARLRGGRVIVVPSSEVLYQGPEPVARWRERAGELRGMLKVYGPLTLLWAIPVALIVSLIEAIVGPFLGRWPIFGVVMAWVWNLIMLPMTLVERRHARRRRAIGDEELFRFQTTGSARLRLLFDEGLERMLARFPEGMLSGFSDLVDQGQQQLRKPAVLVAMSSVLFALVATRQVWADALPAVGFTLPPPQSASDALGAYAGGWNPAGLGSPEVLRPAIAATAVLQAILFDHGGLATALLTVGAFLAGIFGLGRLLRVWGISSVPGYLAGVVLMAGPAAASLAGASHWTALIALGMLPWAIASAVRPWPKGWGRRIASVASSTIAVGVVGLFAPPALFIPPVAVTLWALLGAGTRWGAIIRSWLAAALAAPLLMPWVLYEDLGSFLTDGAAAFWEPWLPTAIIAGVAALGVLLGGDRSMAVVGGWGALIAVAGAFGARSGDLDGGREAGVVGLMAVSLGVAIVAGAAMEVGGRRSGMTSLRRPMAWLGVIAGVLMVVSTLGVLGDGRAGLPDSDVGQRLAFALPSEDTAPTRMLLFGSEDALPGTVRTIEGLGYRVIGPDPRSWDVYLPAPRLGDEALEGVLGELLNGTTRRVGEALAPFGIGWVLFYEDSALERRFKTQLDIVPLHSLDIPAFRNEVHGLRAATDDGTAWLRDGTGYVVNEASGPSVRIAENADFRWGPGEWSQDDWANRVPTTGGIATFAAHEPRRTEAILALAWFSLLVLGAVVLRRWPR